MIFNDIEKTIISDLLQTDGKACKIDNNEFNDSRLKAIHAEIEKGTVWNEIPNIVNVPFEDFYKLMNYSPVTSNAQAYCEMLIEENRKTTLQRLLTKWHEKQVTIDEAMNDLKALKATMPIADVKIDDIITALLERIDNPLSTLPLPLETLNKHTGGLAQGNLMTLAGRTGAGKSAFALQIAKTVGLEKKVIYISLEMLPEEMYSRLLVSDHDLDYANLIRGKSNKEKFLKASEDSKKYNISFTERGRTIGEIEKTLIAGKPDLLILDSVNLVKGKAETERIRMLNNTRELKQMALTSKIPILMVAQLNRGAEDMPIPRMADLKESGSIEEDSDIVFALSEIRTVDMLEKAQKQIDRILVDPNKFGEINCAQNRVVFGSVLKNRSGKTGIVPIEFNAKKYVMSEIKSKLQAEDEVPW